MLINVSIQPFSYVYHCYIGMSTRGIEIPLRLVFNYSYHSGKRSSKFKTLEKALDKFLFLWLMI